MTWLIYKTYHLHLVLMRRMRLSHRDKHRFCANALFLLVHGGDHNLDMDEQIYHFFPNHWFATS